MVAFMPQRAAHEFARGPRFAIKGVRRLRGKLIASLQPPNGVVRKLRRGRSGRARILRGSRVGYDVQHVVAEFAGEVYPVDRTLPQRLLPATGS